MKCPHCGDEISDTTCTAIAVRRNAALLRKISQARRLLRSLPELDDEEYAVVRALRVLGARGTIEKRARR